MTPFPITTRALLLTFASAAAAHNTTPTTNQTTPRPIHIAPVTPVRPVTPGRPGVPFTPFQAVAPAAPGRPATVRTSPTRARHPHPPQPPYNPNIILIDPAHGASDSGATLGRENDPNRLEKQLNIVFANRLKGLLEAQGFAVVLTHTSADENPSPDQRAEVANHSRAVACLLLHATASGHGLHLFTSSLTPPSLAGERPPDSFIAPWDSAQAASIPKSLELANNLSTSLNNLRVPVVIAQVSVKPIDSLTCPALAIEIAPEGAASSVASEEYNQHIAESIVAALTFWRDAAKEELAQQQAAFAASNGSSPAAPPPPSAKPQAKSKAPSLSGHPHQDPQSSPASITHRPAPIIQRRPLIPPAGASQR